MMIYYQGDTIVFDIKSPTLQNSEIYVTFYNDYRNSITSLQHNEASVIDDGYRFNLSSEKTAVMPPGMYSIEVMRKDDKVCIAKTSAFILEESESKRLLK